jgi:outer membrane protein
MKKYILTFLLAMAMTTPILAQDNLQPLSLSDAVEKALQNHLQIQIAEANVAIAANNNNWEAAGRFPTISLLVNGPNSYSDQTNPASFLQEFTSVSTGANGTLDATWVLFDGFKVRISKDQLELLEMQSQENAMLVLEGVMQDVILSYYLSLLAKDQLAVVEEVLALSADRVAYQKVRQEFGQASTFDILQSQDAYLTDSTNFLLQQENYRNALRNLNRAMGVTDLTQSYTLTDSLENTPAALRLEELKQRLISSNASLRNAWINQELSQVNTELAKSFRAPRISLSAGTTYNLGINRINAINPFTMQEFGTTTATTFNAYANITATYNIYTGSSRKRSIDNALVQEEITYLSVQDLQQDLLLQLESAYYTYQNQLQLVQLNQSLVENARQNLGIAAERLEGGQINSFDYRAVQLSFINANQALLNAVYNLKVTEVTLMRLTGDLVR